MPRSENTTAEARHRNQLKYVERQLTTFDKKIDTTQPTKAFIEAMMKSVKTLEHRFEESQKYLEDLDEDEVKNRETFDMKFFEMDRKLRKKLQGLTDQCMQPNAMIT